LYLAARDVDKVWKVTSPDFKVIVANTLNVKLIFKHFCKKMSWDHLPNFCVCWQKLFVLRVKIWEQGTTPNGLNMVFQKTSIWMGIISPLNLRT